MPTAAEILALVERLGVSERSERQSAADFGDHALGDSHVQTVAAMWRARADDTRTARGLLEALAEIAALAGYPGTVTCRQLRTIISRGRE